jgi:hypothetical protein
MTANAHLEPAQPYCAECGQFVDELDEFTGWCYECSGTAPPSRVIVIYLLGIKESWFERNADQLDRVLAEGLTLSLAVNLILRRNRPRCLCCGETIEYGTKGRHIFCRKHAECRTAARRLKYYRLEKSLSYSEALSRTLQKAGVYEYQRTIH